MSTFEQHHSGSGDNVRDKIFVTIKTLAPDFLLKPMEMVFESLRKRDLDKAKTQMSVLKLQTLQPSTSASARGPVSLTSSSSTCCTTKPK